jgi:hypothetical protein
MATIYIEPAQESDEVLNLVQSAIDSEIAKLELALKLALKRLSPFEQKYKVTSEYFIAEMTVEDLDGDANDDEYIHWTGEYKLMQRLREKLRKLQEIEYYDPNLLRPD